MITTANVWRGLLDETHHWKWEDQESDVGCQDVQDEQVECETCLEATEEYEWQSEDLDEPHEMARWIALLLRSGHGHLAIEPSSGSMPPDSYTDGFAVFIAPLDRR